MKPRVWVLDEPLSALDALTRGTMQKEILRIWEEVRQTCVMITNDLDETILLADRIIPLNPGLGLLALAIGCCLLCGFALRRKQTENRRPDAATTGQRSERSLDGPAPA